MRAAIYTRISQDQTGEGLGVQRQFDECVALAERLGWEVVTHFDDNDLSAFSGRTRPGFEAMLQAMKNSEFDSLICWHIDRLYRSMKDLERLIEIADAARVEIRTVQGGTLDLSTSAGRMTARILGSVARQESEHKGERQRAANVQKAAAGKWQTANRPFGYTMTGEPLEPEATMIRQAVTDVLAGKSIRRVAKEWNDTGIPTTLGTSWRSSRVRRLLVNPRYAALKTHKGREIGPGDWTALVDETTHRGLVAHLSDPARVCSTSCEKKYMGSGVYRCGKCGGAMRHAVQGGKYPGGRRYECEEGQCVVRIGEPLDDYIEKLVIARLSRPDVPVLVGESSVDVAGLQTQRKALRARLDELAAMFAESAIDGSQLKRGTADLRSKVAVIDSRLAEAVRVSPVAELVANCEELTQRWAVLSADIKSKIIDTLMVVSVLPAPRGPGFKPEFIRVDWRGETASATR